MCAGFAVQGSNDVRRVGDDHFFALRTQAFNYAWDRLGDNHAETCPLRLAPPKAAEA